MPQEQSNNVYVRFYKLNILRLSETFYKLESMRDMHYLSCKNKIIKGH